MELIGFGRPPPPTVKSVVGCPMRASPCRICQGNFRMRLSLFRIRCGLRALLTC
jgi:hypothetical protein